MDHPTPAGAQHRGPPQRHPASAPGYGRALVAGILADPGEPVPAPEPDTGLVSIVWLGQLMFAMQLAAGRDPRDPALIGGEHRGAELGRAFLSSGVVEVCCDYCAGLLVVEVGAAIARLMRAWHGDRAPHMWEMLTEAIIPGLRHVPAGPLANGNMTEDDLAGPGRARLWATGRTPSGRGSPPRRGPSRTAGPRRGAAAPTITPATGCTRASPGASCASARNSAGWAGSRGGCTAGSCATRPLHPWTWGWSRRPGQTATADRDGRTARPPVIRYPPSGPGGLLLPG